MNRLYGVGSDSYPIYTVDQDCIERHNLDAEDLGKQYIIVNGAMIFLGSFSG
jgi:hypothetical protein